MEQIPKLDVHDCMEGTMELDRIIHVALDSIPEIDLSIEDEDEEQVQITDATFRVLHAYLSFAPMALFRGVHEKLQRFSELVGIYKKNCSAEHRRVKAPCADHSIPVNVASMLGILSSTDEGVTWERASSLPRDKFRVALSNAVAHGHFRVDSCTFFVTFREKGDKSPWYRVLALRMYSFLRAHLHVLHKKVLQFAVSHPQFVSGIPYSKESVDNYTEGEWVDHDKFFAVPSG